MNRFEKPNEAPSGASCEEKKHRGGSPRIDACRALRVFLRPSRRWNRGGFESGSRRREGQRLQKLRPPGLRVITAEQPLPLLNRPHRSAKPLKLTAAGALFLRTEKQVDLLRETAAKQMLGIKGGVRGHVTAGASDYRETFCLAEVLPVFHRLYPLIEVSLTEGRTKELEKMALEGAVDFSLVIRSVSL